MLINSGGGGDLITFEPLGNEMRDYKWKFPNPRNPLLFKSFHSTTPPRKVAEAPKMGKL